MNINSIQTSEIEPAILPQRSNSKADAGTGLLPEPSTRVSPSASVSRNAPRTTVVQATTLVNHIDYLKEQLDKILVDFPPFFPPGSYQRVDLIKGIRNIQEGAEKSSVPRNMHKDISSP
jgi:hypothetical protein